MAYQDLLFTVISRLSAPDFAAIFIGLVALLFFGIHFIGGRHTGREIHKLINLVLSLGLALLLAAASIGLGIV